MAGSDILLYENPYGMPNPRRKRYHRRNPGFISGMKSKVSSFLPVNTQEILAATGGLAAATMIPKSFMPSPVTLTQKLTKVGIALGSAVGASMLAGMLTGGNPAAKKAALLGAIGGVGITTLGLFTSFKVGVAPTRVVGGPTPGMRLGESRTTSGAAEERSIQISTT
jgi:hypothetical protein